MTPEATYTKLRAGGWGILVKLSAYPEPEPGSRVNVSKRSGETKTETVLRILWTGDGYDGEPVALCSIERKARARSRSGKYHHPEYRTTSGGRCEDAPCCGCCS